VNDNFLPARAVWERYGVTSMTLFRWLADKELAFPRPIYLGRFRYWRTSDLLGWESNRPTVGAHFPARSRSQESEPLRRARARALDHKAE
jgi:predicted DNA-binding transcriptional regulator AlpA